METINFIPPDDSVVTYLEGLGEDNPQHPKGVAFAELWGLMENNQGELQLVRINVVERSQHGSFAALYNLLQTIREAKNQFNLSPVRNYPDIRKAESQSTTAAQKPTEELYEDPE